MKNYIVAVVAFLFMSTTITAQIDRTKQPEPGPAPEIDLKKPEQFKLDNGIKVMVVENNVLPRVSYSLRIDNNPIYEGDKAGVASLLSAMLGNGTTNIPKDEFNEEVDFLGANINFGSQGGFASGLSKYADRIMELMADAAINPLLVEEEFLKEKDKLIQGLKTDEKSVDAVANRVGSALSYGVQHPYGEFVTEESVNKVTFEDVKMFYENYFNPNNTYLVVVGDLDDDKVKKLAKKYFGNWARTDAPEISIVEPNENLSSTQINFVNMPNAVQSDISITNNVKLKMGDEDYFAVLVANSILGGDFSSYLNMNLREEHGYTYGARSSVRANRYGASRFSAGASVRNEVTDSAVVQSIKEIKRIRTELVDKEKLANVKAKYVGNFVLALERPQTIANYALDAELNDLDEDFYKDYLENINAVTAEDVMRVANKYLSPDKARIIVVGKGADVLENLEKTGYPIVYYDRYANKVEKPTFSKPLPEGATSQTVFDSYIKAVGGKEKLMGVKSIYNKAEVSIANVPMKLSAEMKSMAPNKESMELSAEGMGVMMKQKFDGEKGYAEQQGQKRDLTAEEVAKQKSENSIFPELYYTAENTSLESVTTIDGTDVYKVKIMNGDKPSFRYYDVKTALLKRVESTVEAMGQTITSVVDFSDYHEVEGIMLPKKQHVESGPQIVDFTITEVKINSEVTDADFQ